MDITPPPVVGSVLQSVNAQQQNSRVQDSESNRRATAARELAALEQQQADAIENTDNDTRVHADTGGQGGRGRAFDEQPQDEGPDSTSAAKPRRPADDGHLDVTA